MRCNRVIKLCRNAIGRAKIMRVEELEKWDERIFEIVKRFGLNPYPQEFEICDHFEMIGYMAYSGMPSRYPHWSYGKSYEREKTLYDYGVGGLPYEMVINSNPCLAYLMRDNTDLLQILTIAHVYAHNDFFANNFTFRSSFDAKYTIERFKNHAERIRSYIEDPSIGIDAVESILDAAHALSLQRSRNMAIKRLTREEEQFALWEAAQTVQDEFQTIHSRPPYVQPNLDKLPLSPEPNLLRFIADHSAVLNEWQADVLRIVDEEAAYFIPQIETKIMNEGWASYWHHKILNELELSDGLRLEFIVRHNQVLRPTPGGINPYHLGFVILKDIERRWNEGSTGVEYSQEKSVPDISGMDENDTPGRKKLFAVREADRDVSFLRRFLTREIMQELDIFRHEKRGKERVITKVSDDDGWREVKQTFITNVGMGSMPIIYIDDADCDRKRTMALVHEHDGRDLQLDYAERTLKHIYTLWGRNVSLSTTINGRPSKLLLTDGEFTVER